jgi:hypothetical protein
MGLWGQLFTFLDGKQEEEDYELSDSNFPRM